MEQGRGIHDRFYTTVARGGVNSQFQSKARAELTNYGVDPARILSFNMDYEMRLKSLLQYLQFKKVQ